MTYTKMKIVDKIQADLGFLRNKSAEITDTVLEIIKFTLASGADVMISGFGKFCVKSKRARKCRNPATGEHEILPARQVVTFKCSGKLRERVNGK